MNGLKCKSTFFILISIFTFLSPGNEQFKSERPEYPRRINRNAWPTSFTFSQMKLSDFDDAHLPTASYETTEWETFCSLLHVVFKDDQKLIERFMLVRDDFIK